MLQKPTLCLNAYLKQSKKEVCNFKISYKWTIKFENVRYKAEKYIFVGQESDVLCMYSWQIPHGISTNEPRLLTLASVTWSICVSLIFLTLEEKIACFFLNIYLTVFFLFCPYNGFVFIVLATINMSCVNYTALYPSDVTANDSSLYIAPRSCRLNCADTTVHSRHLQ